jgi:hypothetical protein
VRTSPLTSAGRYGRVLVAMLAALVMLLAGALGTSGVDQADAAPRVVKMGALLTSLSDFDPADHSFRATFWLWTTVPKAYGNPLNEIDYVNAKSIRVDAAVTEPQDNGTVWYQHKMSGTFAHDWNLSAFPFDRQTLTIEMENNAYDAATVLFKPDAANSSNDVDLSSNGWTVDAFNVVERTKEYTSSFGDPELAPRSPSYYSRLDLVVEMSRNGLLTFLKLSIAAIAAILLAIASYFLHIDKGKEPRFAMLAASVFALVVSLQTAAGAGGEASLTLVDRFHTVALAYVVVAVVVSIIAHIMFNRDVSMDRINRLERNAGISSTAVLVVLLIFLFTTN